jgi:hypothetical protein
MPLNSWSFKNAAYQAKFRKDGIVSAIVISKEDLESLNGIFEAYHVALDDSYFRRFHVGIHSNDIVYKTQLNKEIAGIMDPYCKELFDNYRRLIYSVQIKGTGPGSELALHQDWSVVDEDIHNSATVWIPLCDSFISNGAIHAIPGTHRFKPYPRGGTIAGRYDHLHDQLLPLMEPFECKAGTILVFDSSLLHYSPANLSNDYRVSVVTTIVPGNAQVIQYYNNPQVSKTKAEMYAMSDDFYLHFNNFLEVQAIQVPFGNKMNKEKTLGARVVNSTLLKIKIIIDKYLFFVKNLK